MIGDRDRDRHVDPDHADIDAGSEFARRVAIAGEDCDAVAILVLAGEGEGLFKVLGAHDLQHGAEDLVVIAGHVRGDPVEQRRAEEVAFLMPLHGKAAAVDDELAAFIDRGLDPAFDIGLVHRGDDRAVLGIGIGRNADLECLDCGDQLGLEPLSSVFADWHHHRQRHAAFASRTESRAAQIADDLVQIGIGHHDPVVLRAAHCLDPLARRDTARIDVLGDVA